jgi:antitoxin CptB
MISFLSVFFSQKASDLTSEEKLALNLLLVLGDNDLLDLLLGKTEPVGNLNIPEVHAVLKTLRAV